MTTSEELRSIQDLGWDSTCRAWRLLATASQNALISDIAADTGHDLDELAYKLRGLGHDKPARLAYSVAFVLNGLTEGCLPYDRDLIDRSARLVAALAEMLLELEATTSVTIDEPADLVEHLQVQWGLRLFDESGSASTSAPHFSSKLDRSSERFPSLRGLSAISHQMVDATESLIQRVVQVDDFPYTPALTRIHHLATTIRDRVAPASRPMIQSEATGPTSGISVLLTEPSVIPTEPMPLIEPAPVEELVTGTEQIESSRRLPTSHSNHKVLIIDSSPFFRMLLTSAVESCGYRTTAISKNEEMADLDMEDLPSIIICDADAGTAPLQSLRSAMPADDVPDIPLIALTSSLDVDVAIETGIRRVRRTDVPGLLQAITEIIGRVPGSLRKTA